MHVITVGAAALLVEVSGPRVALSLATWARSQRLDVVDIVPAAQTVLFDGIADVDALHEQLGTWPGDDVVTSRSCVEVPVIYDGADLVAVAQLWGTDVDGVVARHTASDFVSAFCGFAPGFAYLSGLPETLSVPRLVTPRGSVPAGSVGLAGAWCGIYPTASPGGWQLIGRTESRLWDPSRAEPALLAPGTRVRFVIA